MSDYKEIIKELNVEFNECDKLIGRKIHLNLSDAPPKKYEILAEDCCGEMVSIMQTISCAADAIEQLVRERDAAIRDLKYLPFTTCKWVNTDRCKNSCLCERYEWRGVRDE